MVRPFPALPVLYFIGGLMYALLFQCCKVLTGTVPPTPYPHLLCLTTSPVPGPGPYSHIMNQARSIVCLTLPEGKLPNQHQTERFSKSQRCAAARACPAEVLEHMVRVGFSRAHPSLTLIFHFPHVHQPLLSTSHYVTRHEHWSP